MAYTTINKSSDFFNTKVYTGNGSNGHAITGVGFQPDLTWIKDRADTSYHILTDAVRGATKQIYPNDVAVEYTDTTALQSFNTDGFTVGVSGSVNENGVSNVAWNWKAGTGQGSSNTDGSINTTYTSVNTTAGFSISKYTGTGANATVGHGLGVAPKMIIFKNLSSTNNWDVYHGSLANTERLNLNESTAKSTAASAFNSTSPTTSVFSIGTAGNTNASGSSMIAYAFAEKTGYSKFGSYVGNSNTDGTFVYCGFKPAFVILKRTDGADSWVMLDNKRNEFNVIDKQLITDGENAETTLSQCDFLSNGFKLRLAGGLVNGNGNSHIYMAFGQSLVGTNNVPCTAR